MVNVTFRDGSQTYGCGSPVGLGPIGDGFRGSFPPMGLVGRGPIKNVGWGESVFWTRGCL